MAGSQIFATLSGYQRVWAVASIHGEADRLAALHAGLWARLRPGDRLVYLGNIIGRGPNSVATIDELLSFRRAFMTIEPAVEPQVIYLRGAQEEMLQKLLQLQFATDPRGATSVAGVYAAGNVADPSAQVGAAEIVELAIGSLEAAGAKGISVDFTLPDLVDTLGSFTAQPGGSREDRLAVASVEGTIGRLVERRHVDLMRVCAMACSPIS